MSAAAATSQPGNKRQRSSEGQDNTHAGSRGGAGTSPSAASPPPPRFTCVSDSFRASAVTACTKAVYKLTVAKKKAVGYKQSVVTLEKAWEEGTVPKTLKVQLPSAYELHVGPASAEVLARITALERQMHMESLEAKKEKQAAAEREIASPLAVFEREYKELVRSEELPPELLATAMSVGQDQAQVFTFEWIKAQALLAEKSEQAAAARTAAAEKAAQTDAEMEAFPSRELIQDLVDKRVAAALRARQSSGASASAGGGTAGKAKAQAKAKSGSTQGGASGSGKGKQKPKQQAKAPKNAQRK